jgi:GTP-binding protein LepA
MLENWFRCRKYIAALSKEFPPKGNVDEPLQALIFDSHYNPFRGIEVIFRVINGEIKRVRKLMATGNEYLQMKLEL